MARGLRTRAERTEALAAEARQEAAPGTPDWALAGRVRDRARFIKEQTEAMLREVAREERKAAFRIVGDD